MNKSQLIQFLKDAKSDYFQFKNQHSDMEEFLANRLICCELVEIDEEKICAETDGDCS